MNENKQDVNESFDIMGQFTRRQIAQFLESLCGEPVADIFDSLDLPEKPSLLMYPIAEKQYMRVWLQTIKPDDEAVHQLPKELEVPFERCVNYLVDAVTIHYLDMIQHAKAEHWLRKVHLELDQNLQQQNQLCFVAVFKTPQQRLIEMKKYNINSMKNSLAHPEDYTPEELDNIEKSLTNELEDLKKEEDTLTDTDLEVEAQENVRLQSGPRLAIFCDIKELEDDIEKMRPY